MMLHGIFCQQHGRTLRYAISAAVGEGGAARQAPGAFAPDVAALSPTATTNVWENTPPTTVIVERERHHIWSSANED